MVQSAPDALVVVASNCGLCVSPCWLASSAVNSPLCPQVTSRLVNHVGLPICRHLLDHLKAMEFASQAKVSRG